MEKPLQYNDIYSIHRQPKRHNPCFSGKTFAIKEWAAKNHLQSSHNPCFSGKTFAMKTLEKEDSIRF